MKVIAFYLPQFHVIEENNRWWGKGFTEWTNLRKAKAYRKEQYQPREPYNDNYYDLSNIETMKWQAKLAKEYGVYGFCFYHYWFNGKLLLEKPAENLLKHEEIDINYCMSWANEPWSRTWDGKDHEVLMGQTYGDKEAWKEHFIYLLPFFKDKRYIKIKNKPMFLIYKSKSIKDCKQMMELWEELAQDNGFDGVHFVETLREKETEKRSLPFSAKVEFEPARTLNGEPLIVKNYNRVRRRVIKGVNILLRKEIPLNKKYLFNDMSNKSLKNLSSDNTYGGVFVGWDNTPRRGNASLYVTESTKEEFKDYLSQKMEITKKIYKTEYVFINAWNEWCEGTYLEPDKKNKFKYLEAIREVQEDSK
ncbi:glycoside hydrolase family 99-like domain-containing protein [Bacillus salipaludis]|uniref:Glycoside hydrolase family 99-like domain-containing protein n=1 Tax=Bacillus salipaludis TaxID=2547811 RepID=A0ABW8RNR9_9BACI